MPIFINAVLLNFLGLLPPINILQIAVPMLPLSKEIFVLPPTLYSWLFW